MSRIGIVTSHGMISRMLTTAVLRAAKAAGVDVAFVLLLPNVDVSQRTSRLRLKRWLSTVDLGFVTIKFLEIYIDRPLALLRGTSTGAVASALSIPLIKANSIASCRARKAISFSDLDWLISTGPTILPQYVFEAPRRGVINSHGARLPEYRGLANYVWVLTKRERQAYATTQIMVPAIDEGPVIQERACEIQLEWSAFRLNYEVGRLQAGLLEELMSLFARQGELSRVPPRDHAVPEYHSIPSKGTGRVLRAVGRVYWRPSDLRLLGRQA